MRVAGAIFVAVALLFPPATPAQKPATALRWQPWSESVFQQARAQHKFVLLDLEAVWCHWCHVMDEITYRDPAVVKLLEQRYLLIKVDQDSRPDISNRYQDYGWPATVVFAADGSEIVKRQGYLPPKPMASMLQAIIDDPSPGPSIEKESPFRRATSAAIPPATLSRVKAGYERQYDKNAAGWGFGHKYLDGDSVEYALRLSAHGDLTYVGRVNDTLHAATALLDPAWGGLYQYSVGGKWDEPHYEKLISIQASALRAYSLAYAQTQNDEDLRAARSIFQYTTRFLMDHSASVFYVSQDADSPNASMTNGEEDDTYFKLGDQARRARGTPRIDRHIYSRENGWTIAALCSFYAATGDASAIRIARTAEAWIADHRALPGGGYRHDDTNAGGPFLGDSLAIGQAQLQLWNVTGDRRYLASAAKSADFIAAHFAPFSPGTGYLTTVALKGQTRKPRPDRDENIALARFTATMSVATNDTHYQTIAREALRFLASDSVALQPLSAGILLANEDVSLAPIHVTVVGSMLKPEAVDLHNAALRTLRSHEVIEVRDPSDKTLPPTAVTYPKLNRPALFLCTATACSSPVFRHEEVRSRIEHAAMQQPH